MSRLCTPRFRPSIYIILLCIFAIGHGCFHKKSELPANGVWGAFWRARRLKRQTIPRQMQRLLVVAAFKAAGNLAHFAAVPCRHALLAAAFGAADQTASLRSILLKFGLFAMARTAHSRHGQSVVWWASVHDRRVRSRIVKRRTPGQRAEDSDEEQHTAVPVVVEDTDDNLQGEPASGSAGPAGEVDANGGEEVEYTRRQQVSPTRKRGRLPVPGRTKLKGRTSLAEISSSFSG